MITIRRAVLPGDPAEAFVLDAIKGAYLDAATGGRDAEEPREFAHALVRSMLVQAHPPKPSPQLVRALHDIVREPLRHGGRLWIASPVDDPTLYLGWICASPEVLHFVYVKRKLRRQGIAGALLAHATSEFEAPFKTAAVMTWPWVEEWLARNGVHYAPTRAYEQEQETRRAG